MLRNGVVFFSCIAFFLCTSLLCLNCTGRTSNTAFSYTRRKVHAQKKVTYYIMAKGDVILLSSRPTMLGRRDFLFICFVLFLSFLFCSREVIYGKRVRADAFGGTKKLFIIIFPVVFFGSVNLIFIFTHINNIMKNSP